MLIQHGLIRDGQARALGVTLKQQQGLVARGLWIRFSPGVMADAATPSDWFRTAMAATLAPGTRAVLTGAAAARLHSLDGFADIERIIVIVPSGRRLTPAPGVSVRWTRRLTEADITEVAGIRTTTVEATLVALARDKHSCALKALDSALRNGSDVAELTAVFVRWDCGEMLRGLHERVGTPLPRSWFQRLAKQLLAGHGINMVDEWPVRDERGKRIAELDLAAVDDKVGVECQSWAWHGSPAAQRADLVRKRALRLLGWDIIDLWWSDLDRMDDVVLDIVNAIDRSRRLQAS